MADTAIAGESFSSGQHTRYLLTQVLCANGIGFDPLFWLHHVNTDRILQLWSSLHPETWVTEGFSDSDGTVDIPPWTAVNDKTRQLSKFSGFLPSSVIYMGSSSLALTPFIKSSDGVTPNYWISADTRDTGAFNYSYPEYNDLDLDNPDEVKHYIRETVDRLYGDQQHERDRFHKLSSEAHGSSGQADAGTVYKDWTAHITVEKYALGSSFSVLIFLGNNENDPGQWTRRSTTYVGAHSVFVSSDTAQCVNCTNQQDGAVICEGFVHLTSSIVTWLGSLHRDEVTKYLKENLAWRVVKVCSSHFENMWLSSYLDIGTISRKHTLIVI